MITQNEILPNKETLYLDSSVPNAFFDERDTRMLADFLNMKALFQASLFLKSTTLETKRDENNYLILWHTFHNLPCYLKLNRLLKDRRTQKLFHKVLLQMHCTLPLPHFIK
ncbi:MAG: hypothetical protein VSS75_014285 [Candidatus Parabeggiatoa sp.]|nr:hypothetical protein [Candidatus Parabeggiatoa sp.]